MAVNVNLDCYAGLDVTGDITVTGTVDGVDIAALSSTVSGLSNTTINSNADNRIITGSGTANTLNGESTITYDNPTLEINTDTSPYAALTLNGNSGGLIQFEDNETAKWSIFGESTFNIYDNSNSASRLLINSSGNVGIGTNSPSEKLEVSGDIQVTSGSIKVTGATPGVRFTDTAATGGFGHVGVNNTSGSLVLRSDDGNALSGTYMGFEVDSGEKMRIDSSGRVLIGTTIEGHASADNLTINDSGNSGITIRSGSSDVGTILFSDATSGAGEYAGYVDYYHSDNRMTFGTSGVERMRIDSSGRLLLGTTTAGESNGDEATFANTSGNAGITIRSAVDAEAKIYFSEGTSGGSQYRGAITYNQNTNYMSFATK